MAIPRSKKALTVILGLLAVIFLAIGLAMYFTSGIANTATAQLEAIKSGNVMAAYDMTSKAFQNVTSTKEFEALIANNPIIKNYKHISYSERKVEDGIGYLNGIIEDNEGHKLRIEYQLIKENEQWKIQGIRLSDAGIQNDTQSPNNDGSGSTIHDVLINDTADTDGYVSETKKSISKSSAKIFATVEIIAPNGNGTVKSMLILPDGEKIGPLSAEITKSGNILKAFSFTRPTNQWQSGEYEVVVTLSSGDMKTIKFNIN